MSQINGLNIEPPLLNSSCPWASSFEQLEELYQCKFTGAVTTRTATMDGFDEHPDTHTVAFARDQTASLNSYGYSPHPLATYLKWIENLFKNSNLGAKHKPIILSIAPADPVQLGEMMDIIQGFRRTLRKPVPPASQDQFQSESEAIRLSTTRTLAVELNTSCPNIPGHPPPAYDVPTLTRLLLVLATAYQSDPTLIIGLKLAPYVYRAQMENIVETISALTDDQGRNPIAFLTCTNTLGGCVMFADQVKETPKETMVRMGKGKEEGKDTGVKMALPTTFGGLAGEPLHFLSVGNVMNISSILASSPIEAVKRIGIIGVGGVTSPAAYKRMRDAGAAAVACATSLGMSGVGIFEKLLKEQSEGLNIAVNPPAKTMAATSVPEQRQYPPKIEELQRSMDQAQNLVEELKTRLFAAQAEYEGLRQALLEYKASIAPIRKCPPEVTLMIFELYLLENPRLVRRLLLVCKQWYEIASGAPQLWNRIPVEFNDDWDVMAVSNAINRRVEACIRRSGSLLLELHLDFSQLPDIRDKIASRLNACIEGLIGPSADYEEQLYGWMNCWQESDFDHSPKHGTLAEFQPTHALSVLRKLIGDCGISACRWGSLELRLPRFNIAAARQFWTCFICPTPNLTRLVIHNSDLGEQYDKNVAFPDLSSLKHLKIDAKAGLGRINAQNSPLKSLVVPGNFEYWASYSLPRFKRLERLELRYDHTAAVLPAGEIKFTFPELRELTLHGEFPRLDVVKFQAPRLRFLTINRQASMSRRPRRPYGHPKLQPIDLRWEVTEAWSWSWSIDYLRSEMRETVLCYPTAEHFHTGLFLRDLFIQIVRKLHLDGNLSSALKCVTFDGEEGGLETVEVRDLLVDQ